MKTTLLIASLGLLASPAFAKPAPAKRALPAVLELHELTLQRPAIGDAEAIDKRVRIALPKGWTGDREMFGRALRLYGPEGEGKMLVAGALHPSELTPYLDDLKRSHPSAAPSPPQKMDLPGIRPELGERATRFVITGQEVGEMVLIERRNAIVLIVTVVDPNAWPAVAEAMNKAYATVEVVNAEPAAAGRP